MIESPYILMVKCMKPIPASHLKSGVAKLYTFTLNKVQVGLPRGDYMHEFNTGSYRYQARNTCWLNIKCIFLVQYV